MTNKRVRQLRDLDRAVDVIQSQPGPISFNWFRESFKRDSDLKDSLDYGKAILDDVAQLDQYLYTYGKMIQSQWEIVVNGFNANSQPLRIVDYGCGQGLAAVIISDCLGSRFSSKVKEVTLIEPSDVALIRAEAVYKNLFPRARVVCLNKTLDDLKRAHFSESEVRTLHIFSNILDIPAFDISKVFSSALTNGDHTVLAVSHNRDFAGGAKRLRAIKEEIDKVKYRKWIKIRSSKISEFNCGGGGKFAAISWYADLEIDRG
jgi:ribosomal protein RSM22 (predicted rRNA methylase)